MADDRAVLGALLQRLGLPISLVSQLLAHSSAVAEASERLGLVSTGDLKSIVARHIADSLLFAVVRPPQPSERWVDVGSGAGFPGLVLACCYPQTHFTLVEPSSKRAGFLELQAAGLGLANATVLPRRMEEVEGGFDVASSRAFQAPEEALLSLKSLVRPGGAVLVAVGPHDSAPPGATVFRLEDLGDVDSPGTLFMMSREG